MPAQQCPRCGSPALPTTSGRWLTVQPHPLGLYDPTSGEVLTQHQLVARLRTTQVGGHSKHTCPVGQASLFDVLPARHDLETETA